MAIVSCACAAVSGCHEKSVRPGVNDSFRERGVDKWLGRFESESREIFQQRERIADAVGVKRGDDVADVGAGTGFLTLLFAERVGPSGTVYGVDIKPDFLDLINQRAAEKGLTNIETVLGTDDSVGLAPNSIDLAFICDTYHHFEFPKSTMASIRRALRPGGGVIIIDFDRVPGESRQWVLDHVRGGRAETRAEMVDFGFEWVEDVSIEGLKENFFARFRISDD